MKKAAILFLMFMLLSPVIAHAQSIEHQLNKSIFVFKNAYDAMHSADLVASDHNSGTDTGAYQNYVSALEDKGLAKLNRESKIVFITDIRKHPLLYGGTYITMEFVKIREKNGVELGWVGKDDLTKVKKKK